MRIVIFDTYYRQFLARTYGETPGLSGASFEEQRRHLLTLCFGTSDFYSKHLNDLGWGAVDLIGNCVPLQFAWARENGLKVSRPFLQIPHRFYRVPVLGPILSSMPGLLDVAVAQVLKEKPDILYVQDLSFFPGPVLEKIKEQVPLVVGQIASPLPPREFIGAYDLILTSFPHFVDQLRGMGIASEYFRIGFEERVLNVLGPVEKDIDVTFVGGISPHHSGALPLFERLAEETPIQFFGYGADKLADGSPIRKRHHGEVWGLDMYRALARSRITLNRHIGVAGSYANNMRLYEATGVGTLLLTDAKKNLGDLFAEGTEVVAYQDADDAVQQISALLADPQRVAAIAAAGQRRTLGEHTYRHRMVELTGILERAMARRRR
jgi:hypothetical protein